MATKIFLDTNIIIDYFDNARPAHELAKEIVSMIEIRKVSGNISESVINTSVYLLRKSFSIKILRDYMGEFVSMLTVLSCTNATIKQAYLLDTLDLEDAVLFQLAFENNMDYFISSDKNDFKKLSSVLLPVVTAKEFLKMIK